MSVTDIYFRSMLIGILYVLFIQGLMCSVGSIVFYHDWQKKYIACLTGVTIGSGICSSLATIPFALNNEFGPVILFTVIHAVLILIIVIFRLVTQRKELIKT